MLRICVDEQTLLRAGDAKDGDLIGAVVVGLWGRSGHCHEAEEEKGKSVHVCCFLLKLLLRSDLTWPNSQLYIKPLFFSYFQAQEASNPVWIGRRVLS